MITTGFQFRTKGFVHLIGETVALINVVIGSDEGLSQQQRDLGSTP